MHVRTLEHTLTLVRSRSGGSLAALLATSLLASASAAQVGTAPPKIDAVKWYNTPPLALEALAGKAVLVEVFRTW